MSEHEPMAGPVLPRPELLLTVEEAAERLAVSRSFLYQLLRRGALPSVTIGRARRVLVSDLEVFVDRLREEAENEAQLLAS